VRQPCLETDEPAPLNWYGETKLRGERVIQSSKCRHVILRTSWVFGPRRDNFVLTMRRLFTEQEEVRVVDDQFGAPTSAPFVAQMTRMIVERPGTEGLFHLTAAGHTSRFGLASRLLELDRRHEVICRRLIPVSTAEMTRPARRPAWSVLSCEKFERTFGVKMTPWEDQLSEVLASLP